MTDQAPYTFTPRWKEELVCSCSAGSFVLEMPMGRISVLLPTEQKWTTVAPDWAKGHWSALRSQLAEWCARYKYPLYIDETAQVYEE